jgi:hypothetical protein
MIRRADITTSDSLGTPEPGVYVTVKDADGNLLSLFDDDGDPMNNPLTTNVNGGFHYNIADADAGAVTEEYRLSLSTYPRRIQVVDLGAPTVAPTSPAALDLLRGTNRTIASGVLTIDPDNTFFAVAAEGGASTDTIDTINGGTDGRLIIIRPTLPGTTITLAPGGNIDIVQSIDLSNRAVAALIWDTGSGRWDVVASPGGGSIEALNVKSLGVQVDGTTNDTADFQAAIDQITADPEPLFIPAGTSRANLTLTQARGLTVRATGRTSTFITSVAGSNAPALSMNGLWYTTFSGLSFRAENGLTDKGVVEQDGNFVGITFTGNLIAATSATLTAPWTHGTGTFNITFSDGTNKGVVLTNGATTATWSGAVTASASATIAGIGAMGTQGITWEQCDFDARGTANGVNGITAFYMNRQGGDSGQGSECLFLNDHFYGGSEACYWQVGFNALNQIFVGGNFQSYPKNGIRLDKGSAHVIGTGFQCGASNLKSQFLNNGFDVNMSTGGANEGLLIYGIRSESMRLFKGGQAQRYDIRANSIGKPSLPWAASHPYILNDMVVATTANGLNNLYVCTTAGTSGSSAPTWPDTGTVTDNGAVWTQTPITVIDAPAGEYCPRTNYVWFSNAVNAIRSGNRIVRYIVGPGTFPAQDDDELIEANATSGSITFDLNSLVGRYAFSGKRITIMRADTTLSSTNTVTITGPGMSSIRILPGGAVTFQLLSGHLNQWWIVVDTYRGPTTSLTLAQLTAQASANQVPLHTSFVINDLTTPAWNATPTGGGAVLGGVKSLGSAWVCS